MGYSTWGCKELDKTERLNNKIYITDVRNMQREEPGNRRVFLVLRVRGRQANTDRGQTSNRALLYNSVSAIKMFGACLCASERP